MFELIPSGQRETLVDDQETIEGRGTGEVDFDPSDFANISPTPIQPDRPAPFSAAIEAAVRHARKALAVIESHKAAASIGAEAQANAEAVFQKHVEKDPSLARFGINVKATAFLKAPVGFYKEPARIVQGWLDLPQRALARTGKEIIAALQDRYPGYSIRADYMSRPLNRFQKKHIQSLLSQHGVDATVADCNTLSRIKRHLLDHQAAPEYDTYKIAISFAKDGSHLILNGKRYSIFRNGNAPSIKRGGKVVTVSALRKAVSR